MERETETEEREKGKGWKKGGEWLTDGLQNKKDERGEESTERGTESERRVRGSRKKMGGEKIGESRSMQKGGLLLLQRWSHCNIHAAYL